MKTMTSWKERLLPFGAAMLSTTLGRAQTTDAAITAAPATASMETAYLLLAVAVLQVVIILSLSGILRTLGGTGTVWTDYLKGRRAAVLLVLLGLGASADLHAATGMTTALISVQALMWWLIAINVILFAIIVGQLSVVRGMARTLSGKEDVDAPAAEEGPTFADTILQRLTRSVKVEQEKDVLMHHEYDGIRELDNVLPPWWLWLFYGTVVWSVVFLLNVHVLDIWPTQEEEYRQEMAQAKADVDAYLAQFAGMVDETNVTALTDETAMANGQATFETYCKACHGGAGEGGVGPNLTDDHWIHGGGVQNVFKTIKYGVPEKGMIAWKTQLKPIEMQAVASYILKLHGTDPPNGKAPEGEVWKEATTIAPVDSTAAVAADSTAVAVIR
ncbi:MAG TPA: cbb3-type cytochrome c oxidase N-terminal domain-containing protein [Flavobacteriales bacterium]|nr:cbb3-type cytochrome c oxidase N-terminal domain-containing protein [Flavobacteriales bacterium]HMR26965.1 cbb3-type cytochrome c oxidase N-terminal domain-containing protein [Flavobacteriales bacterium]